MKPSDPNLDKSYLSCSLSSLVYYLMTISESRATVKSDKQNTDYGNGTWTDLSLDYLGIDGTEEAKPLLLRPAAPYVKHPESCHVHTRKTKTGWPQAGDGLF